MIGDQARRMQLIPSRDEKKLVEDVHPVLLLLHHRVSSVTGGIANFPMASYFIAGIHVNSSVIAMKKPAIFRMVGGDWEGGPTG